MKLDFAFRYRRGAFELDVQDLFTDGLIGVFGPSGCGKTTLLHLIAGIERADAGHLRLDDEDLWDVPVAKRRVAVVFQNGRLFPHLSVEANLRFGMNLRPVDQRRIPFDEVVQLLGLEALLKHRPHQLSGGQTQRVALGRAILSSPRLLLLDEPLASLDRGLKSRILPYLRRIRDQLKVPMIHVSHDLTELLTLTTRLVVMNQGRMIGRGPFLDLVQQEGVLEVMHGPGLLNVTPLQLERTQPTEGVAFFQPEQGVAPWIGPLPERDGGHFFGVLRPEDIALVRHRVLDVSIQNQIQGVIENVIIRGNRALCVVDCGVRLLAEVTPFAVHNLKLHPGQEVFCLFKAQALTYLPGHDEVAPMDEARDP